MSMRWIIVIAAFLLLTDASFAQEKQTARPEVGQPVAQAGELLKAKKYKEALQKLAAADAVPDKTPYERYVIEGTRAAIDLNSGKSGWEGATRHHMLRSDLMGLGIEVDEISGPDVYSPHA